MFSTSTFLIDEDEDGTFLHLIMTKIRRKKLSCSFQPYPHDQDHPDHVDNVEKNMVLFSMIEDEDDTNASSCMTYMYAKHGFF